MVHAMITFNVVRERHGWAVRMGEAMKTPFWSREIAIREANCMADSIRSHGEFAEVVIEGSDPDDPPRTFRSAASQRLGARMPGRWNGPR
jgi:hypothetical protein